MSILIPLLAIAAMVAFNALYVAAEFATVGSRRSRVQEDAEAGDAGAAGLAAILEDPQRVDSYVATCQVGITISSLVAGAYAQSAFTPMLEPLLGDAGRPMAIVIVLLVVTSLQVVLGELLPKTVALRYPERLATATLPPMRLSQILFRPLVAVFNGSAFALMRAWNLQTEHSHAHVHSPEELAGLYRSSAAGGLIDVAERDMLAGVLNVDDRLVREIMTPRRRLISARADETVAEALPRLAATSYTRFPVTGEGDDVVGLVQLRDVYLQHRTDPTARIGDLATEAMDVGDVLAVPELWRRLRDDARHCAMVVNEFGSVVGMVTLEDALEEVFGEVQDEFDDEEQVITVAGGRVRVRGDVLTERLVAEFGFPRSVLASDTVGGLVWHRLGRRPRVGDEVAVAADGPIVRVEAVDDTTVLRVSFEGSEQAS